MTNDEFQKTWNVMMNINDKSRDFNYLQLLVFDWREKRALVSKKLTVWNISSFIGWVALLIVFCIMKFAWNNSFMLAIFSTLFISTLTVTIIRGRYSKQYERYDMLINKAKECIKEL